MNNHLSPWRLRFFVSAVSGLFLKARLHWRFYLNENVGILATVSMFVVMDVYDSQGKQIHAPWGVAVWKIEKVLFLKTRRPKVQSEK